MAKDCVGEGTGWGTIENVTLRVLLLADVDRAEDGRHLAAALDGRHDVTLLADRAGPLAVMTAGKAARGTDPHLVHAFGLGGYAKSAPTVASGMNKPLIVTLAAEDFTRDPKRCQRLAERVDALIVDDVGVTDAIRALGIERDLYVIGTPKGDADLPYLLGAYEIVYGRVLGARDAELEEDEEVGTFEVDGQQLVQIGSLAKKGPS